jgi:hypothetical protein
MRERGSNRKIEKITKYGEYVLYSSSNIVRIIKSRVRKVKHMACRSKMRILYKSVVGKS